MLDAKANEAAKIYFAIFRGRIPDALQRQWDTVPDDLFAWATGDERITYERIVTQVRDLEAIEFAARIRGCQRLLTSRFQLMVYLAECQPQCRPHLICEYDSPWIASLLRLAVGGFISVYKLGKGLWLLRSYGDQ